MGIAFSIGVLLVIGLWVFFGYIWDYPLRKIRSMPLAKLHLMFKFVLPLLLLYVFFPEWISDISHASQLSIRIVSITLTGALSFIYHYASNTEACNPKTNYCGTKTAQNTALVIVSLLSVCMIALLLVLFDDVLCIHWIPSLLLSIWLGLCSQIVLRIETELFLSATKHSWK